jgi:hypothetical protein
MIATTILLFLMELLSESGRSGQPDGQVTLAQGE